MHGWKCKNCKKILREHTRKERIPKSSPYYQSSLKMIKDDKPTQLVAGYKKLSNGEILTEPIILHPPDKYNVMYMERKIGKHYLLTWCDECYKKRDEILIKKRKERAEHNRIIKSFKPELMTKQMGECYFCDERFKLEVHHIIPFSQGGEPTIDNCILVCKDCHAILSNKSGPNIKKWVDYTLNPLWEQKQTKMSNRIKNDFNIEFCKKCYSFHEPKKHKHTLS